jgi:hypothetical protein
VGIWYSTEENVKRSLDSKATARDNWQVAAAIEASSRFAERLCHRAHFYPLVATRYFDWPDENTRGVRPWRLRLGRHTLISLTSLTVGGDTIASGYLLEPVNDGPPYHRIELDLSGTTTGYYAGDTHQRAIGVAGVWGETADTVPGGALAEALDSSETSVDVTDSSAVGVGSLITAGTERMNVTGKALLDSGQNLGTNLAEDDAATTVNLGSGAAFTVGEELTIDSETMLLVSISGNNGTVLRAWNGSTLAAHTSGADIYAPRTLTVERGAVGTTAAAHDTATALTVWDVPGGIEALVRAEAVSQVLNEQSGWARTAGEGENAREAAGKTLDALRKQAKASYGRNLRSGAV